MKALVTGAGGQVADAWALAARGRCSITALSRRQLDITDAHAVADVLSSLRPDLILNAAAFTAVDRAESEPGAAWRANRDGPTHLAREAVRIGARLIHISTDFVFGGGSGRPWRIDDPTAPQNVYGASKLAGEEAVLDSGADVLIVRTAWVYAASGRNFLNTMLRLMREGREVRVVADQIGSPTAAASLAGALWRLIELDARGLRHFTDAGVASWYDFAVAIAEEGLAAGHLDGPVEVRPIRTEDFPTPAKRPSFSVLDCATTWAELGWPPRHWRESLRQTLDPARHRAQMGA